MADTHQQASEGSGRTIEFWRSWALTVGVMIGSGVFLLPAVLAPYGGLSFVGWCISGGGAILLAMTLGHLAGRTTRVGGPYAFAHDAFGDFTGFLTAWGYWISICIAVAAIAVAFTGYAMVLFPVLEGKNFLQALVALTLVWVVTGINLRGMGAASFAQLAMTMLKLIPLVIIIGLGAIVGETSNLPEFNPEGNSLLVVLSATALLTMWAFAGLEASTIPTGDVIDPQRTIPRAVVWGTITVVVIYVASTAAVMALIPANELAQSTSPFADAARALGTWGPPFIAVGAMISTAGSLNGNVLTVGQVPMAAALDGLAPKWLAQQGSGRSPQNALVISAILASVMLLLNYSRGLVGMFSFLIVVSTMTWLVPIAISVLADLRFSIGRFISWTLIGGFALAYILFAVFGSNQEELLYGSLLILAGIPVYFIWNRDKPIAPTQ